MTDMDRKKAAKAFSEYWKERGDEKSDCQSFWLALLRDVLGVTEPEKVILFEERVFSMLARSIPIALSPTFTTRWLCRPSLERHTKQTIKRLCKPTASGAR